MMGIVNGDLFSVCCFSYAHATRGAEPDQRGVSPTVLHCLTKNHQPAPPSRARPIRPKTSFITTWPTLMATNMAMTPARATATFKTGDKLLIVSIRVACRLIDGSGG